MDTLALAYLLEGTGTEAGMPPEKKLQTSLTRHPARDDEFKIRQWLATVT
jgi:hypothetical protein